VAVDQVVEQRSAGDVRRQIEQRHLVVISNELVELGALVGRQQDAEAPEEREHVQALVATAFAGRRPAVVVVVGLTRQEAVEQRTRLTDAVQLRVDGGRRRQTLLDELDETGERRVE